MVLTTGCNPPWLEALSSHLYNMPVGLTSNILTQHSMNHAVSDGELLSPYPLCPSCTRPLLPLSEPLIWPLVNYTQVLHGVQTLGCNPPSARLALLQHASRA